MATDAITIQGVRFSYCSLFQPKPPMSDPNGAPKYSTTILVPKNNVQAKALIDQAINAAIERGVANPRCWNGVRPPRPAIPLHDGDGVRPSDGTEYGPECKGCWVFTASSKDKPFVVDINVQGILDSREVYSGMWGNVNVTFYPYNNTKKGIGCSLNGVQKVRDDEPLGAARVTAAEAFQPVPQAPEAPLAGYYPAPGYGAPVAPASAPGYGAPVASAPASGGYPASAGYGPALGYNSPQTPAPAAPEGYSAPVGYYDQGYPAPGYGAPATPAPAPSGGYSAPGYGAPAASAPAPGQGYTDPNTGEVFDGYTPSGMPVAGI